MRYTLNGDIRLTVDSYGAEAVSAVVGGEERLWQNPTGDWNGHAPVLFPVCGNCAMSVQGKTYALAPHGFAKRSEFLLSEKGEDFISFLMRSSAATEAVYPYRFSFEVTYRIAGNTLTVEYRIVNGGETTMYASCGGHESFVLDRPIGEYRLEFPAEERFTALLHDENGKLTGETEDFGTGKSLDLPSGFLRENRTLIFRLQSRSARLLRKTGERVASVTFGDFPYLLLWRPNDAPMICIEPWHNLPDGENPTEFARKEGVMRIPAGGEKKLIRTIEYGTIR